MTMERGEYVITTASGTGHSRNGYVSYKINEELVITSKNSYGLNVRHVRGGPVFRISSERVRPVLRPLGQVPEGGIEPDDPRVAWIFEDAGRLADRLGLCSDFDRIAEGIGAPGRERIFTITFDVTEGMSLTAKVTARSRKQAEQKLRGTLTTEQPTIKSIRA